MKFIIRLCLYLTPVMASSQAYQGFKKDPNQLLIQLSEGTLSLTPLTPSSVRVKWQKNLKEERELVLINNMKTPAFKVADNSTSLTLTTDSLTVTYSKQTNAISYADKAGKTFLNETAGSRKLVPGTVSGQPCYLAEQTFDSPQDEYLFGLGQFQDGQYNVRNVPRKLIQVNSQIAIPFMYSSRGFGILWHQYGLTEFNPADNQVALSKKDTAGGENGTIEVTTTAGTQRVSQRQSLYTGKFSVPADGDYSIMLDLGNMESRHLLVIDGAAVIDQSNQWLPPAAGKVIHLTAGEHSVQIVCKASNVATLSWRPAGNSTTFRSVNAKSLDYVVFYGNNADEVISSYRNLSGEVPMLPLWAYGFWQCRERYTSGEHLVNTVAEFRKRHLPMDVIVQDWQYWGKYGWGVPKFDEANYPEPEKFIKRIHDLNAHFSVSVWENLNKASDVAKPYIENGLYIPNSPWIDIYNPAAKTTHWNALNTNLFSKGVDSWWMDATEPENDSLIGKQTFYGLGDFYRLTYPLEVSQAVYEGQRATDPGKRVTILTRSAFPGQQRYGTINWSGDIGWSWDTYKRQIVAGLNYNLTGMPYWTTDIGGFFRPGRGQYTDLKYHDILTRWFQFGTFNAIFRIHGYQTETEPWKYGDTVETNMRKMLNLRYRLMPYIYSEAWQVHKNNSTMMRPLVMDFKNDPKAISQEYQYMFGKAFLVAPITEPDITKWDVYLPTGQSWYDFWTGKKYDGGQTVKADAPQDQLPLFVKAGAIIPVGKQNEYTGEASLDTLEIRIYTGADGTFMLYNDSGDGYDYEKGQYKSIPFTWNEKSQTLTIEKAMGSFAAAPKRHLLNIVWVNENAGLGAATTVNPKAIVYTGSRVTVKKGN